MQHYIVMKSERALHLISVDQKKQYLQQLYSFLMRNIQRSKQTGVEGIQVAFTVLSHGFSLFLLLCHNKHRCYEPGSMYLTEFGTVLTN